MTNKGQTSLEYILLIFVVVSVSLGVFKQIEQYLVTNPNSVINSYLDTFKSSFGVGSGIRGNFKTFKLRR